MFTTLRSVLPTSAENHGGTLAIGGVTIRELATQFGTPLVVYDERQLEASARTWVDAFSAYGGDARVVYASKAFASLAMLELMHECGLGADVASGGELAFALAAGIPGADMVLHGNNKSRDELRAAVDAGVGLIVVDSEHELTLLSEVAREAGVTQRILVRVTPGIEAETHRYIRTGHTGSKFGVEPDVATSLLLRAQDDDHLHPEGVHVHLGSQMLDLSTWRTMIEWLATYAVRLHSHDVAVTTIDLGGGLGIAYTEHHTPPAIDGFADSVIRWLSDAWTASGLTLPTLIVEPGRSIAGPAAVTVYEVGTVKETGGISYVNVDGGMSDNLRPMLYQAEYRCLLADRLDEEPTGTWWIAGKHCESGDILIEDAPLVAPQPGDLLVVAATGAYTMSMASNYNALPRPAIVFVRDGEAREIVRRETIEDLMARDNAGYSHTSARHA